MTVFKPTESDFKEKNGISGKKMILAVANVWNERKGFLDVLKLAEMLNDNYRIVMVGLTEEQKKSLPGKIIGITRTNDVQELVKIYSAADVFVNTTYEDNFPTVNIEALACGLPVITYRTGGSPEALLNESCGKVVNQGDISSVYDIITGDMVKNINCDISIYDKTKVGYKYLKVYN